MMSRKTKQYLILSICFFFITLIGTMVYFVFFKPAETCFDGKKNQNEQGMDCGGVCALACKEIVTGESLQIKEARFVQSRKDTYDVVAKVFNPNGEVGAGSFSYTISLKDVGNVVLASRSGSGYILPFENKYILEFDLQSTTVPMNVSVDINMVEWEHFSGYQEKPAVNIYQKKYNEVSSSAIFGEAIGLVSNESPYDFRSLTVQVILRDKNGTPLAMNSTLMNTLHSNENRDFRLTWPNAFPGIVENVEMIVDADVYHSDNFIRQYTNREVSSPSPSGR